MNERPGRRARIVLIVGGVAAFLWPHDESRVYAIDLASLQPGTPADVYEFGVFVVRLEDGRILAFSKESPHIGGPLTWVSAAELIRAGRNAAWLDASPSGVFIEPRHGETFAVDGTRLFGPAPRDLDWFPVTIEGGWVVVDLSKRTLGARPAVAGGPNATPAATLPGR